MRFRSIRHRSASPSILRYVAPVGSPHQCISIAPTLPAGASWAPSSLARLPNYITVLNCLKYRYYETPTTNTYYQLWKVNYGLFLPIKFFSPLCFLPLCFYRFIFFRQSIFSGHHPFYSTTPSSPTRLATYYICLFLFHTGILYSFSRRSKRIAARIISHLFPPPYFCRCRYGYFSTPSSPTSCTTHFTHCLPCRSCRSCRFCCACRPST